MCISLDSNKFATAGGFLPANANNTFFNYNLETYSFDQNQVILNPGTSLNQPSGNFLVQIYKLFEMSLSSTQQLLCWRKVSCVSQLKIDVLISMGGFSIPQKEWYLVSTGKES